MAGRRVAGGPSDRVAGRRADGLHPPSLAGRATGVGGGETMTEEGERGKREGRVHFTRTRKRRGTRALEESYVYS